MLGRLWRCPAALIFIFFVCFYGFFNAGHTGSPDEEQLILQTHALLHGHFTVQIPADAHGVVSARKLPDGKLVPTRGLGQSIVAAPFYLVGRIASIPVHGPQRDAVVRFFLLFTNSFVTAGIAVVLYALCRELGASVRGSTIVALGYGIGTLAWPHAENFFTEPLSTLFVTTAFTLVIAGTRRSRLDLVVAAGLVAGAAPFSRVNDLIFLPIFGVALCCIVWARERARRDLARLVRMPLAFGAGAAAALAVWMITNQLRYGSPTDLGYSTKNLNAPVLVGLKGYIVSPSRSLILHAPLILVALVALPIAFRRRPAVAATALVATFANMYVFAHSKDWWGGQAWGPRFLDITLPLVVALAAFVVDRVPWRRCLLALVVVGCAINFLGVAIFYNAYYDYANNKLTQQGNKPHAYVAKTRDDWYWAPIAGHARLLESVAKNTWRRIDGEDKSITPLPSAIRVQYFWWDSPIQLNVWWAWWLPMGAPGGFLVLAPLLLAGAIVAALQLRKRTRPVAPDPTEPDDSDALVPAPA